MTINTPNDLYNFLVPNGLGAICPEAQNLVVCLDTLARMCSCDPQEAKNAKYNQCKQNYVTFVSKSQSLSGVLLSKAPDSRIIFYLNGQLLGSISR